MGSRAHLSISLTSRDVRIIVMVYSYWGLTTDVIARAFWPRSYQSSDTHYGRLRRLTQSGYLHARQISTLSSYGTSRFFYTLGRRGLPIVSHQLHLTRSERLRSSRIATPAHLAHHASASHFRLSIERAAERLSPITVSDWQNETALEKCPVSAVETLPGGKGQERAIQCIADRAFTLYLSDNRRFDFLVEIDRATVPRERTRQKLRGYLLHARAEPESAKPVLWVVPHQGRREALITWAKEEAADLRVSPTIFAVALSSETTEEAVLGQPIWQVPGLPLAQTLVPCDVPHKPLGSENRPARGWLWDQERGAA